MLFSVIVPTYNGERYLKECLDSVAWQSFQDFECIVIDDGSTDGTASLVEVFVTRDPRFRYVRQDNGGTASARNHGIKLAKGDWIAFLDSDDTYFNSTLLSFYLTLKSNPSINIVGGQATPFRRPIKDGAGVEWAIVEDSCCVQLGFKPGITLLMCCSCIRRTFLEEIGCFRTDFEAAEDIEFWTRATCYAKVAVIQRVLAFYRPVHADSKHARVVASGQKLIAMKKLLTQVLEEDPYYARKRLEPGIKSSCRTHMLIIEAIMAVRNRRFDEAALRLSTALSECRTEMEAELLLWSFKINQLPPSPDPTDGLLKFYQDTMKILTSRELRVLPRYKSILALTLSDALFRGGITLADRGCFKRALKLAIYGMKTRRGWRSWKSLGRVLLAGGLFAWKLSIHSMPLRLSSQDKKRLRTAPCQSD